MKNRVFSGEKLFCPRPNYSFPIFDTSLQKQAFKNAGKLIYGVNKTILVESNGIQWFSEELLSDKIIQFFVDRPDRFYHLCTMRYKNYEIIKKHVIESNKFLNTTKPKILAKIFKKLCEAYILALRYVLISNLLVDDITKKFENMVRKVLSIGDATVYFTSLLKCPSSYEAITLNFSEDKRGTKRIQDISTQPVVIFSEPVFLTFNIFDSNITNKVMRKGIPLNEFMALRFITPLVVQFSEEFKYADYSIRSHLKHFLNKAGNYTGDFENIYNYNFRSVISKLK